MSTKQKTLQQPFTLEGKGLHTGLHIKATFMPAPDNTGIVFKRIDISEKPEINSMLEIDLTFVLTLLLETVILSKFNGKRYGFFLLFAE